MKLFTAVVAAMTLACLFIYASSADWHGVTWSFIAFAWQIIYLIELWQKERDY